MLLWEWLRHHRDFSCGRCIEWRLAPKDSSLFQSGAMRKSSSYQNHRGLFKQPGPPNSSKATSSFHGRAEIHGATVSCIQICSARIHLIVQRSLKQTPDMSLWWAYCIHLNQDPDITIENKLPDANSALLNLPPAFNLDITSMNAHHFYQPSEFRYHGLV